jgi:hypothetical protein
MKSKDACVSADEIASFVLLAPVSNQMAAVPPSPGTRVKLLWHGQSGQQQALLVSMNPDEPLQNLIDRARHEWGICDDIVLCLRKSANREIVGGLDRAFKDSGLGGQALCVDFADEAFKKLHWDRKQKEVAAAHEQSQKEAAVAYQHNAAAHEKWRSTVSNPVELFRYDLKRHARILDHVMNHATDEQLHRLFNTHGLLSVYNMVIGTFQVDPTDPHTAAVNLQAFQKFGQCPDDGLPFCSKATREKYMTRWDTAYLTGDVPKYTPPPTPPRTPPPTPPRTLPPRGKDFPTPSIEDPGASGGGKVTPPPEPLKVETFGGFGELIRASKQKSIRPEFPSVQNNACIASFKNVDLKHGETEYFEYACEIVIATDQAGALVPQISFQKSLVSAKHIVDLQWLKKKQSVAPVASAPLKFVPISQALSPGPSSFSKLLQLDSCELRVRFGGDSDVLLFEEAIRYLYVHFTAFAGEGQRLGGTVPQETIKKCALVPHLRLSFVFIASSRSCS